MRRQNGLACRFTEHINPAKKMNAYNPNKALRHLELLQIKEPVRRLEDVVLSDDNASLLDELLQEHHRVEALQSYGLHPADKILFCGPPGCGKTLTAEVLASELGLPLAIVRIDSVISSLLGETAANLRQVFDFVSTAPMVVLFDEFDAMAKERSDEAEHGELKRVVNAFLQMLDAYEGKSLLVAATNHERILDSAVWRRFDEVLVFESPNLEQLRRLLSVKLRGLRREFKIDDARIVTLFKGMSHADVERVLRRAAKDMVLAGKEFLSERHLQSAIKREEVIRMNEHLCNNGYVCNNCFLDEIMEQAKKEDARNTNAVEDLLTELGCGCDDSHAYECDLMSPHCSVAKAEVCYTNLLLSYKNLKRQFMQQLEQIILDNSTVHAPCDTRYIARCNPQKEQEIGREQVLDEIRELLRSLKNETK